METKEITFKHDMSVEDLLNIIKSNPAEDVAKAFKDYMSKQLSDWCNEYTRAQDAEKEIKSIKFTLADVYLKQLKG